MQVYVHLVNDLVGACLVERRRRAQKRHINVCAYHDVAPVDARRQLHR